MDEQTSADFLESHPHLSLSPEFVRDFERDCDSDRSPNYDRLNARLALARAKQRELRESGACTKQKNPDEKFAENPTSWKKAIGSFCYQCMGRSQSWRDDVDQCSSPDCPLYGFRPMRRRKP